MSLCTNYLKISQNSTVLYIGRRGLVHVAIYVHIYVCCVIYICIQKITKFTPKFTDTFQSFIIKKLDTLRKIFHITKVGMKRYFFISMVNCEPKF